MGGTAVVREALAVVTAAMVASGTCHRFQDNEPKLLQKIWCTPGRAWRTTHNRTSGSRGTTRARLDTVAGMEVASVCSRLQGMLCSGRMWHNRISCSLGRARRTNDNYRLVRHSRTNHHHPWAAQDGSEDKAAMEEVAVAEARAVVMVVGPLVEGATVAGAVHLAAEELQGA